MSLYNSDGQINLTVVDGNTLTGAQAPDGSYYIVLNDGSTYTGYRHPCGAMNAVVNETATAVQAPNGSIYVKTQTDGSGYTPVSSPGASGASSWPPDSNDLATMLDGTTVIWNEPFNVLSLRTGGPATGNPSTGYNAPTSRGIWSPNGLNYMSGSQFLGANSYTYTLNPLSFNWQSIDPTFPALGMMDITANGLVLKTTGNYPAIRAGRPTVAGGNQPYLGALVSTSSSAKFSYPYMIRIKFTLDTMGNEDFPALWTVGEHYALDINNTAYKHNEIDYMERFGADYTPALRRLSVATHIDTSGGFVDGGTVFTYPSDMGPGIQHELVGFRSLNKVKVWMNGTLVHNGTIPSFNDNDRDNIILNSLLGMTWRAYVAGLADASITVRSVEVLKPAATASDLIPPTPPTPVLSGFTSTVSNGTPNGTVLGTVSGASTYSIIGYTGLTVSGSNLVTNGTLVAGTHKFYLQGVDAFGTPAIIPAYTLTVTGDAPALTSPTMTATDKSAADISVTTDNATGTLYWIADTNTSTASQAQVKAGQNAAGSAAAYSGSVSISSTGLKTVVNAITASAAATAYSVQFMHESSGAVQSAVAVAATTSTFQQESFDYYNLFSTPATLATKQAIDTFISGMKTDGNWATLDACQIYAMRPDLTGAMVQQVSLLDMKNPARVPTVAGGMVSQAGLGFVTDGVDDQITTNIIPSAGPNMTQNSIWVGYWSTTSAQQTTAVLSAGSGASQINLGPRTATDAMQYRANQNTAAGSFTGVVTNGSGFFSFNRSASNATQGWRNGGGSIASSTQVSSTLTGGNIVAPGFLTSLISTAAILTGGSRNTAQNTQIYNRLRTLMTALGVA